MTMLLGYLSYRINRLKNDAYDKGYYDACYDITVKQGGRIYCGQYMKFKYDRATKMLEDRKSKRP